MAVSSKTRKSKSSKLKKDHHVAELCKRPSRPKLHKLTFLEQTTVILLYSLMTILVRLPHIFHLSSNNIAAPILHWLRHIRQADHVLHHFLLNTHFQRNQRRYKYRQLVPPYWPSSAHVHGVLGFARHCLAAVEGIRADRARVLGLLQEVDAANFKDLRPPDDCP